MELNTKKMSSYRQVPTFGRDTIRRFRRNVSDLQKMAARDYEDILQVSHLLSEYKGYDV